MRLEERLEKREGLWRQAYGFGAAEHLTSARIEQELSKSDSHTPFRDGPIPSMQQILVRLLGSSRRDPR
jgi:hypothetical protein